MREGCTIRSQPSCTGKHHRFLGTPLPRLTHGCSSSGRLRSRAGSNLLIRASFRPEPSEPPYNKYRSRADIQQTYINEWLHTTATDDIVAEERRTFASTLMFIPSCLKFYVVPLLFRYIWYVIWTALRNRYLYPFQKKFVRWDCQLDAYLAKIGNKGKEVGFSRAMALARFHFKIGVIGDLRYRVALLRNGDLGFWRRVYKVPVSKFHLMEGYEEPEKEQEELAIYVKPEDAYGCLEPRAI
ncbi:hypothetical protein BSKO_09986 [Bryopsis sp. KO-2023]|nr:hypothetical protein BSKO_09986 [Bryopsis sp. KO-2023]